MVHKSALFAEFVIRKRDQQILKNIKYELYLRYVDDTLFILPENSIDTVLQ